MNILLLCTEETFQKPSSAWKPCLLSKMCMLFKTAVNQWKPCTFEESTDVLKTLYLNGQQRIEYSISSTQNKIQLFSTVIVKAVVLNSIYRLRHRKCNVRIFIHKLQNFGKRTSERSERVSFPKFCNLWIKIRTSHFLWHNLYILFSTTAVTITVENNWILFCVEDIEYSILCCPFK